MYDVMDISRYVINYCNENGYDVTNLRLQKLLYFIQANFLVSKGLNYPCFEEEIEAWSFGPVVPEVYHEYKTHGNSQIPLITHFLVIDRQNFLNSRFVNYRDPFENDEDRNLVNEIADECNTFSTSELVEITHNQKPWKAVYVRNMNNTITKASIYSYFMEE